MRRPNLSHPLARDDDAVNNDRHGKQNKTNFITGTGTFCTRNSLSFYPHTRTVTPQYLPPSITDSVTTLSRHTVSHLSSSVKPSSFQENLKTKKTGDSSHTNPPLACSTPQYAARVTLSQRSKKATRKPAPEMEQNHRDIRK